MSDKLEVVQNGVFTRTREPVFQLGTTDKDGNIDRILVPTLMTEDEAKAKLKAMSPAPASAPTPATPAKKAPAVKKAPAKKSK